MRDLALLGFLAALLTLGLKRPFLLVLAYAYVDIVAPQRLSWGLLSSIPLSMLVAAIAVGGWAIADDKKNIAMAPRQWLMLVLLLYCGATTFYADVPVDAQFKWEWVWKAMAFAIFLPLTLRTKLRIEALILFMTLSAATIVIVGSIKTILSGGGYGELNLLVDNNSGLYESSTISTVAIALIPLILWLARHGTVFPPDWRSKTFAYCLVFACLLIPVGTQARTGLVCIAVLAVLMLRDVKRRLLYLGLMGALGLAAVPFLPSAFTDRMGTISTYQADNSAVTRLAVWGWTWEYVQDNPMGGGFEAYRLNRIQVATVSTAGSGNLQSVQGQMQMDSGRAWHSAYFEMLGEQGFPGLILFILIHGAGLVRMERLRRRYLKADGDKAWISPLATALQHFQLIYLVGALFVAIAFQPFVWMLIACQIAFDTHVRRMERAERPGGRAVAPARIGQPIATSA